MFLFVEYRPYLSTMIHGHPIRIVVNKVFIVVWRNEEEFWMRKVTAMATARRYTMEQIEAALKKLRSLPVKEAGKTRGEVAEFLVSDIKKAMRQGYTLRDIRDLLADAGVSVPLTKLKALFDKASDLEPVKERDCVGEDTARPDDAGEGGQSESIGGI